MEIVTRFEFSDLFATRAVEEWGAAMEHPKAGNGPLPIPFTYGFPDPGSFPIQDLIQATAKVMHREGRQALQYGQGRGFDGLLDVVVDRLVRFEGIETTRQNLIITNGSLHALDILCHVFINPGETVIIEAPCFHGSIDVMKRLQGKPVSVSLDDDGMRMDELAEKLSLLAKEGRKPKFIYTIPNFHNPGGVTMTLARRHQLLNLAAEYKIPIIEDDAYRDLYYEGEPLPSLYSLDKSAMVVRMGTFAKVLAAGMRLGWALGPEKVISKMLLFRSDTGTNQFGSRIAAEYCREHLDDHIADLVRIYRGKRDAMLGALEEHVGSLARWTRPQGGFYVWLELADKVDPDKLQQYAKQEGVSYLRGDICFVDGRGKNAMRLSFSYPSVDEIVEGVRRLGRAIRAATTA